MVILFHRPPFTSSNQSDAFSIQELTVRDEVETISVSFKALWKRAVEITADFEISVKEKVHFELYYDIGKKQVVFRNYAIINPFNTFEQLGYSGNLILIGRYSVDSSLNCFLYIRSHFGLVEGIENVLMEEGESSVTAIGKKSEELKNDYEKLRKKREFLSNIDILDSLSYLEAQLDLVTRQIVAPSDDTFQLLEEADKHSVTDINSRSKLRQKINKKKTFREYQKKYYDSLMVGKNPY